MQLETSQRRDLIALLCRIAWADGSVAGEERERLLDVLARVGQGAVSQPELEAWLRDGPPRVLGPMPAEAKQLFVNEAMRIISADHNVDPAEMRAMRDIVNYYFTRLDDVVIG